MPRPLPPLPPPVPAAHASAARTPGASRGSASQAPGTVLDGVRCVRGRARTRARPPRDTPGDAGSRPLPGAPPGHRCAPVAGSGTYLPGGRPPAAPAHPTAMTAEVADAPRVPARTQPAEPFEGHARSGDVRAAEHGEGTPPWNEEDAA